MNTDLVPAPRDPADRTPITIRTRDGRGRAIRTLAQAELDTAAARLRGEGMSYQAIAERLGCSKATAHDRVQRALAAVPVEDVEALRKVERARLDEQYVVARREMLRDHLVVQAGKIVKDDDGVPLVDHGAKLSALDRMLRIAERRARLEGLDQQVDKVEVISVDALDAEIARLAAELEPGPEAGVPAQSG